MFSPDEDATQTLSPGNGRIWDLSKTLLTPKLLAPVLILSEVWGLPRKQQSRDPSALQRYLSRPFWHEQLCCLLFIVTSMGILLVTVTFQLGKLGQAEGGVADELALALVFSLLTEAWLCLCASLAESDVSTSLK